MIITCLYSCSSTPKLLCHTWKVRSIDFTLVGREIDSTVKAGMVQQLKDSMVVIFYKNHTNKVTGIPEEVEEGTWKMDANPHIVHLKNSRTIALMTIKSIDDTSMVATIAGQDSTTFYCNMYKAAK